MQEVGTGIERREVAGWKESWCIASQSRKPSSVSTMAYRQTGPTFAICGTLSGTTGISASRWPINFNHETKGYKVEDESIPPNTYLESLNMLFSDDAADWAESNSDAVRLLAEPEPTQATVYSLKSLFCERFPTKAVELKR